MASLPSSEEPSPAAVEAFLRRHPDFLRERPELLAELSPERDLGTGVVDFQGHALRHLRAELADLKAGTEQLVLNARANLNIQTRTHEAVIALLAAESFDALVRAITDEVPMLLRVDLVMLCFEPGLPRGAAMYVQELRAGGVDRLLGEGKVVRLRAAVEGEPALYGSGSGLVASDALVRLPPLPTLPAGLIALGSRRQNTFHPGQASELLTFLATVIAACVRRWVAP